jgi:hypothetical protein
MNTNSACTADVRNGKAPAALPSQKRTLLTISQLAQQQPALTVGGIRWDLFNRTKNGLAQSGAIIQRRRKILIDADRYLDWLSRGREGA